MTQKGQHLRSVGEMTPEEKMAAIAADVMAKVEPHLDKREQSIVERSVRRALQEFEAQHKPIAKAHGWRAAALSGLGGIGLGILIGWLALNGVSEQQARTVTEAVAQGVILDDVRASTAPDDKGVARRNEPASVP